MSLKEYKPGTAFNGMACIPEGGADPGAPVAPFYKEPFEFTGTIHSTTFDVSGDVIQDDDAELKRILARQ